MVLRRTLPSRLTGGAPASAVPAAKEAPAVPAGTPQIAPLPAVSAAPSAAAEQAAALAAALQPVVMAPAAPPEPAVVVAPEPAPVATPAATPSVDEDFTTPPASTGPRVLEDSFAAAPVVAAVEVAKPAPVSAPLAAAPEPAQVEVAAPAEPATSVPAVQPATLPEAPGAPQGPTDFLTDNPFAAGGNGSAAVASRPPENPLRRRVPKGNIQPLPPRPKRVEPTTAVPVKEERAPTPEITVATPAANPVELASPTNKPAKAPRHTTPRDFAAATVQATPANTAPLPAPELNLAPEIPVDTRPLDKVDEELIASGIIAGPAADTLTSAVPTSMAVAEEAMPRDFLAPPPAAPAATPIDLPSFTLATAPLAAAPSGPSQPLPPAQGGWEVEPTAPTPPPDIFKPIAAQIGPMPAGFDVSSAAAPSRVLPPTLPEGRPSRVQLMNAGRPGKSWVGTGVALAALVGVGLFVWNRASAPGGLEAASQRIAQLTQPQGTALAPAQPGNNLLPPPTQVANGTGPVGNAQIEFAPPPIDPSAPIMAQGTEAMPEDVSLFARLQREVQAARAEREGGAAPTPEGATTAAAPSTPLTKAQSDAELAEYRRLLAEGDPTTAPKPREFLKDPEAYMDGNSNQTAAMPDGALLPPPATRGEIGNRPNSASLAATLPPPNELYTNNPQGLPIVAEPQMQEAPRIRQLGEFAAELFPQETSRVKVPQGLRPRMAATEFPSLEVLSFVPGKGLIATANGKEGVLMVGETIEGWELTSVSSDMAEFKAGGRSYVLTAQN